MKSLSLFVCVLVTIIVMGLCFSSLFIHHDPQVVVLSLDAPSAQALLSKVPPSKVLNGDRAALWWTVFQEANHNGTTYDARLTADDAVITVYGPPKP